MQTQCFPAHTETQFQEFHQMHFRIIKVLLSVQANFWAFIVLLTPINPSFSHTMHAARICHLSEISLAVNFVSAKFILLGGIPRFFVQLSLLSLAMVLEMHSGSNAGPAVSRVTTADRKREGVPPMGQAW